MHLSQNKIYLVGYINSTDLFVYSCTLVLKLYLFFFAIIFASEDKTASSGNQLGEKCSVHHYHYGFNLSMLPPSILLCFAAFYIAVLPASEVTTNKIFIINYSLLSSLSPHATSNMLVKCNPMNWNKWHWIELVHRAFSFMKKLKKNKKK